MRKALRYNEFDHLLSIHAFAITKLISKRQLLRSSRRQSLSRCRIAFENLGIVI